MSKVVIVFNAKATEFMCMKEKPTKARIDASWQKAKGLRLRPTTRKTGPHMMPPFTFRAKGVVLEIDEATLEKMQEEGMPADFFQTGERLSVIDATYDWIVLLPGEDHEQIVGSCTVTIKN